MRISNGKIVEDLPGFSSSFNSRPVIGEVVSAGDGRFSDNRRDYNYDNSRSSDNNFGLNNFLNEAFTSSESNNNNDDSGFNSSKFFAPAKAYSPIQVNGLTSSCSNISVSIT